MKKLILILVAIFLSQSAFALDQIIKPYESARSASMGGVVYTTGLYDENFWGNPARAAANPTWRVSVIDVTAEGNSKLPTFLKDLSESGDKVSNLGETAGNNDHGRLQTAMPAIYISTKQTGKMSYALAFLTNTQADLDLRNSFQIDPGVIIDAGPAFTVARNFREDNSLSLGATLHADYRLATNANYSFVDLLQGHSLGPAATGGDGSMVDFDLGGTYKFPVRWWGFEPNVAATMNDVLGGRYSSHVSFLKTGALPPNQNRREALGFSVDRDSWGKMGHTVFAVEISDIGNNPNGSFYRETHIGGETRFSVLSARLGLNQGYLTAGVGLDLKAIEIDFATYGEEMALNTGEFEDRRYALHFALQI